MSQSETVPKNFEPISHGATNAIGLTRKSTENGSQSQGKLQTMSQNQTKSPKMSITVTGPVTDL